MYYHLLPQLYLCFKQIQVPVTKITLLSVQKPRLLKRILCLKSSRRFPFTRDQFIVTLRPHIDTPFNNGGGCVGGTPRGTLWSRGTLVDVQCEFTFDGPNSGRLTNRGVTVDQPTYRPSPSLWDYRDPLSPGLSVTSEWSKLRKKFLQGDTGRGPRVFDSEVRSP